jgi:diguanylate cyclase (GGDEF)-like protein
LSAHECRDQDIKAFRAGRVNHFLGKPFEADQLFHAASLSIREQQVKQKEAAFHRELEQRVREVTAELEEKTRILQEVSITDNLTGLYNQRHFYHVLGQEMERARRQERPLSLLLLDIDGFKNYNDRHGHQDGDEALMSLGEVIRDSIRKNVDSGFRYGGDEFTVILPETNRKQAKGVAERIVRAFAGKGRATLSIGLVDLKPIYDLRQFVKLADEAMYRAKHQGGNRVFAHISKRPREQPDSWGS